MNADMRDTTGEKLKEAVTTALELITEGAQVMESMRGEIEKLEKRVRQLEARVMTEAVAVPEEGEPF